MPRSRSYAKSKAKANAKAKICRLNGGSPSVRKMKRKGKTVYRVECF